MIYSVTLQVKVLEKQAAHLICEIEHNGKAAIYEIPLYTLWDEEDHPAVGTAGPLQVEGAWAYGKGLEE